MILDNGLILAGSYSAGVLTGEALPNGGVAPGGINDVSETLALDAGATHSVGGVSIVDLGVSEMELAITVTKDFTATEPVDGNAFYEFRLVSMPLPLAKLTDATTLGKLTSTQVTSDFVGGVVDDMFTLTAHGLLTGTPFYFSEIGNLQTAPVADKTYYVIRTNADVFQIALTRADALAGTAVEGFAGSDDTITMEFYPYIHATTGPIPMAAMQAGAQFVARVQPYAIESTTDNSYGSGKGNGTYPGYTPVAHRYLALQTVVAGGSGAAGLIAATLGVNAQSGQRHFPTAYEVL